MLTSCAGHDAGTGFKRGSLICARCVQAFRPKRRFRRSRFCSSRCRSAAWRERALECVQTHSGGHEELEAKLCRPAGSARRAEVGGQAPSPGDRSTGPPVALPILEFRWASERGLGLPYLPPRHDLEGQGWHFAGRHLLHAYSVLMFREWQGMVLLGSSEGAL